MYELNLSAKISLNIVFLIGIIFIVYLIVKDKINVEFGLLWIFAFLVADFVVLSSKVLTSLTSFIGGIHPSAGLSILAFAFVFLLLIIFTANLTDLHDKIKRLSQHISFLELKLKQSEDEKRKSNE